MNINTYSTFEDVQDVDVTTFEHDGIKSSKMFSVVIDIVDGLKYNTKEEIEISINRLEDAKKEEIKRIKEIIEIKDTVLINSKDFNNIIHNFIREVKVIDNIIKLFRKIEFGKDFGKHIIQFIQISSLIMEEYAKNMLPQTCKCFFGHSSFKI